MGKGMRRIIGVCLIVALIMSSAVAEDVIFGDRLRVAYCNEYITLREEPSPDSKAIARVPLNSELIWLYQDFGGYSYVRFGDQFGYVASEYLELLPDEEVPEDIKLLKDGEAIPEPDYDLGCLYVFDGPEYYPVVDIYENDREYLMPGDEMTLIERTGENSKVLFKGHYLTVPNDCMVLKDDFSKSPVILNPTEEYRLNAFFSSITQVEDVIHYDQYYQHSNPYEDEDLIRFALGYLQLNHREMLRHADNDSWAGYTAVIEGGCICAVIDRYFTDNICPTEGEWYQSVYYESIKEYHFLYTGESWEILKDNYSQVDSVNALADNRYAIRYHSSYNNGFAIIHAPTGLESSRDWTIEFSI